MVFRVLQYGEQVLREEGEDVTEFGEELSTLVKNMLETMKAEGNSIGLAAPQVGISKKVCISDIKDYTREEDLKYEFTIDGKSLPLDLVFPLVLVNPVVTGSSDDLEVAYEGCMSFPGIYPLVIRPEWVEVTYQDVKGDKHVLKCNGFFARNVQHEVDHVYGTLFIDRVETRTLNDLKPKLKKLKRTTRDFLKNQGKA